MQTLFGLKLKGNFIVDAETESANFSKEAAFNPNSGIDLILDSVDVESELCDTQVISLHKKVYDRVTHQVVVAFNLNTELKVIYALITECGEEGKSRKLTLNFSKEDASFNFEGNMIENLLTEATLTLLEMN